MTVWNCGIGYATASRFVNESGKVVILDSNQEALDNAQSELSPLAGGICADVSSPDEIEAAFKEVDEIMLRINSICPGYVLTPMQKAEYSAEMLDTVNARIPMGVMRIPKKSPPCLHF